MKNLVKETTELDNISRALVELLKKNHDSFKSLFNVQLDLLKLFDKQVNNLEATGYCDYEVAYALYMIIIQLIAVMKDKSNSKTADIYNGIQQSIRKKASNFKKVLGYFKNDDDEKDEDPLINRFKSLSGEKTHPATKIKKELIYREWITPVELERTLREKHVLLIDYRPKKDYLHNHIKFDNLINIEPRQIESLPESSTDSDLEEVLRVSLSEEEFQMFLNRNKFDLIVVYNYNYGSTSKERLYGILDLLEKENPFTSLIGILLNNKYISSRLKIAPLFLSGGILNWYHTLGADYLETSSIKNGDCLKEETRYLTSFSDYLSNSKESLPSEVTLANGNNSAYIRPVQKKVEQFDSIPPKSTATVYSSPKVELPLTPTSSTPNSPAPPLQPLLSNGKLPNNVTAKDVTVSSKKSQFLELYATGLVNLGNSCYMNCVIQCLAATPQLTSFFFPTITESFSDHSYKRHINVNNKLGTKGMLTTSFVELILSMLNNNGRSFSPSKFKKIMGSLSPARQFASFDQQDCIEFLNFLLDALHEDLNQVTIADPQERKMITELTPEQEKNREILPVRLASTIEWERYLKLNFSIIVDYFQGQYLSQLKCLECGFTSTTYNAFSILSLPIPEKLNKLMKVSLDECLQEFVTTELLDDNNKWYCPNCKKFTKLTKKIAITRLPQVLIINFKRFKMTASGGFHKLETFVTYPVNEELDMTPYWPDVGSTISANNSMSIEREKEILSTFPVRSQVPPFKYKLFGVANHYGNLTTGHYTAYVHKSSDSKKARNWCYFDDSRVTFNKSPNDVLNKNAYCLFFQRI